MPRKDKKVLDQFSLAEIQSFLAAKKKKAKAVRTKLVEKRRRLQAGIKDVEKQLAALTPVRRTRKHKRKKRAEKIQRPEKKQRKKKQKSVAGQTPSKQNPPKKPATDSQQQPLNPDVKK